MIETIQWKDRELVQSNPRVAAIRAALEAARATFHALILSSGKSQWQQKSPSSAWTIGEVFVHLTWSLEYLPKEVESALRGKGMFNAPGWLGDPLSYWYGRWAARSATPEAVIQRYDRAMDAAIQLLDTIKDDEWSRGADFYGEGFHSVEDLFYSPARHLKEHTASMQGG